MLETLLDNDVLIKSAAYGILDEVALGHASSAANIGVLSAAKYVCSNAIAKRVSAANAAAAQARLTTFLGTTATLDPTNVELEIAIELEELAARGSGGLDSGESQLVAILIVRALSGLVTGDKRAIAALAKALNGSPHLSAVTGRLICMEQAVLRVAVSMGCSRLKAAVCAEPGIDKAVSNCFSCTAAPQANCDCEPGLKSYISHVHASGEPLLSSFGI
jgi:hypothetical protein